MKVGPNQSEFEPTEGNVVKFSDVQGVDEAKEVFFFWLNYWIILNLGYKELRDVVLFLKDPTSFTALGGKLPKGVLLTGLDLFLALASAFYLLKYLPQTTRNRKNDVGSSRRWRS